MIFGTSDDKDRVYGVLGMVNNNELRASVDLYGTGPRPPRPSMRDFPVDYSKSVSEVYQDVVDFALSYDDNLYILCRYEARPDPSPDLPSWAVDWRKPVHLSPFVNDTSLQQDQRLVGGPFQSLAKPWLFGKNALRCQAGPEYPAQRGSRTETSEQTDPLWRSEGLVVVPPFCRPGELAVSLRPCSRPFALRPSGGGGFVFLGSVAFVSREHDKDVAPVLELPETL